MRDCLERQAHCLPCTINTVRLFNQETVSIKFNKTAPVLRRGFEESKQKNNKRPSGVEIEIRSCVGWDKEFDVSKLIKFKSDDEENF